MPPGARHPISGALRRLTGTAVRRPAITVGITLALAIAGGVLALGLRPSTGIDTLVSSSAPSYRATTTEQRLFGAGGVQVLISTPLTRLLAPAELRRVTELEACLAGQYDSFDARVEAYRPVAAGSHAAYGGADSACGELMRARAVKVVYGPGTFLNHAVSTVNDDLRTTLAAARAADRAAATTAGKLAISRGLSRSQAQQIARAAAASEGQRQLARLERIAGATGVDRAPSVRDQTFLKQLVLAADGTTPAPRFHYLFATADAALISVRLRQSLSDAQQARAIDAIRRAVSMPRFALGHGGRYTVTGETVVTDELAGQVTGAIGALLAVALAVMAVVLLIVFRGGRGGRGAGAVWLRLLPLAVAVVTVGITFGALAALGARLTIASIAVLPILVGLAVDYAVQFQARVAELADARPGPVVLAAGIGGPPLVTAALATIAAFCALELSPVPMVRGFALVLVAGVAVALVCALTAGAAVLGAVLGSRGRASGRAPARAATATIGRAPARLWALLAPSVRGARQLLGDAGRGLRLDRLAPLPGVAVAGSARRPVLVLALAASLAAAGWAVSGQTPIQSDITKLVPQNSRALRDLRTLERVTGVSGELDLLVRGRDVASPATIAWMSAYRRELLRHFGDHANRGCAQATLCPALSLPDLFETASGSTGRLTRSRIGALLETVPRYFSGAVLTPDHRAATLAFGIRLMPLARQQRVIDYMRARLHPPPGVSATLTGLPVLAGDANASLSSVWRRTEMLIVGLLAVALVLLAVLRSVRRALTPIVPIVLATGWSALVVFAIGIPLNPMSATLGALVIAISTEFSVLLSERFEAERAAGRDPRAALQRTYRLTGAAVLTSGVTAIAGFAVLVVSRIEMLRQFGVVTLIDLTVSLVGVLVVLPAVLALSERQRRRSPDPSPSPVATVPPQRPRVGVG